MAHGAARTPLATACAAHFVRVMLAIAPYQTERLTVQRDRVHVVRLLDRREVSARLRDAGICEAEELHLAPRFPLGFEPNTHRPFLVGPS